MATETTPYGLPIIEPDVDYIRSPSSGDLSQDINKLATKTNAVIAQATGEIVAAQPRLTTLGIASADNISRFRNLVPNPGPNAASPSWSSGWAGAGTGTRAFVADTSAPSGTGYLRMTFVGTATSTSAGAQSPEFNVTPGASCAGSIYVRSSKGTIMGATLYFYNSSGAQIGSTVFNLLYQVPANTWKRLEITGITVPTGTVTMRIGAAGGAGGVLYTSGDTLDFSAAILTSGGKVRKYASGDSPNGYWEGAAVTSVSAFVDTTPVEGGPFAAAPGWANRNTGFNRSKCLYVPEGGDIGPMRRRIAAALARSGNSKYKLAWAGHSIVAGQGGTPGVIDNPKLLMQRAFQAGPASSGLVTAYNNTTRDARVSYSSGFEVAGNPRGNMQLHVRTRTAGETYTYTSNTAGTVVEIYTFGNSASMQYSIDGGPAVEIVPSGANAGQITRVTGLSNTTHTVTINSTVTGTYIYILGIAVTYAIGLEVSNLGYSGSIASDWVSGAYFFDGFHIMDNVLKPDGVVIQLGANELIHSVGVTSLVDGLTSIISGLKSSGRDVVMVVDPPIEDATKTTWLSAYVPALYGVADATATPLVDFTSKWMTRSLADMRGFYADQWHPNNDGYWDLHEVMVEVLLP